MVQRKVNITQAILTVRVDLAVEAGVGAEVVKGEGGTGSWQERLPRVWD